MKIASAIISLLLFSSCHKNETVDASGKQLQPAATSAVKSAVVKRSFLALGDSYTIGESVSQPQSFPYQLVEKLSTKGKNFDSPTIIARTGWTTADLQKAITGAKITAKYDFVTLCIGVNNQFQKLSKDTYRAQFRNLLSTAINFANGQKTHVIVISIPDWGLTPYGKKSGRSQQEISADINKFNGINKEETLLQGASYTDITPASRKVAKYTSLVASDGLHPSAKMYAQWVDAIIETYNKDN